MTQPAARQTPRAVPRLGSRHRPANAGAEARCRARPWQAARMSRPCCHRPAGSAGTPCQAPARCGSRAGRWGSCCTAPRPQVDQPHAAFDGVVGLVALRGAHDVVLQSAALDPDRHGVRDLADIAGLALQSLSGFHRLEAGIVLALGGRLRAPTRQRVVADLDGVHVDGLRHGAGLLLGERALTVREFCCGHVWIQKMFMRISV